MEKFDFINAIVCFNGDPYMAENEEEVKECEDFVNSNGVEVEEITPENKEDFEDICKRLDLNPVYVKRVYAAGAYNQEGMFFCLDSDWDFERYYHDNFGEDE